MENQQEKIEYDQVEQTRVAHEQLVIILQPALKKYIHLVKFKPIEIH